MEDTSSWSESGSLLLEPRFPPGQDFKMSEKLGKMEEKACNNTWQSTLFGIADFYRKWFSL